MNGKKHYFCVFRLVYFYLSAKGQYGSLKLARMHVGLVADKFGWVNLTQLTHALQQQNNDVDIDFIEHINLSANKVRWEIDRSNNRIRAMHGHSYQAVVGSPQKPPDVLSWDFIKKNLDHY